MRLTPINPLSHQRTDESRARSLAADTVKRLGFLRQQPDLDRNPAVLARTFGSYLRFGSVGHGLLRQVGVAARLLGIRLAAEIVALGRFCGEVDGLAIQTFGLESRRVVHGAGVGENLFKSLRCVRHGDLHCSDHPNIWGSHISVNGVPITNLAILSALSNKEARCG